MAELLGLKRPVSSWRCRWCGARHGQVVLDLGSQPAADHFPRLDDPESDAVYPLRMVLCSACGLAQLEEDATSPEEPLGVEPAALVQQATSAVRDLEEAGLAAAGMTVAEFGSPHGGSWLGGLEDRGLLPAGDASADLIVDTLGLMHEADQAEAFAIRVGRMADEGVLALHIHTLATIMRDGTWNALRHGHFAYLSVPVLVAMAAHHSLVPVGLWDYSLYGGTVLICFARASSQVAAAHLAGRARAEERARSETRRGVTQPAVVAGLGTSVRVSAEALRGYLDRTRDRRVAGYGAASRAVALLQEAKVTAADLVAVADAAESKHGRSLPGSRIPIVSPQRMLSMRPDRVLLFVPDLLSEVRDAWPELEADGGRWVLVDPEPREVVRDRQGGQPAD